MHPQIRAVALLSAIALAACSTDVVAPTKATAVARVRLSSVVGGSSYVMMTSGGRFRDDIAAQVAAAGGTLQSNLQAIGVATAVSDDPNFAARARKISGVWSVDADTVVQWVKPEPMSETVNVEIVQQPTDAAHVFGEDESFWNFQWNARAVHAPEAWAAGQIGTGARVAVIDGGISKDHIDLVGRLDLAHAASFVPGLTFDQDAGTASTFRHATHVAGIIAANDNGIGTIGIAPGATIIPVKALQNGSGSFAWIINAIEYASTPISEGGAGANIINMSLGAVFAREPNDGSAHLMAALSRATSHARQRGVLVLAATGNNGLDLDHAQHVVAIPAQSVGVLAIAATGPNGFALGSTDFARPAAYSNIGQSLVSFAAPGGADDLPTNALCTIARIPATQGKITNPCWVFDMVLSPASGTGGYNWADGTSMATPAAAGVAALIWGKYGPMSPAQLEQRLRASATDLAKPGNDDFYGAGFLNAGAAVK